MIIELMLVEETGIWEASSLTKERNGKILEKFGAWRIRAYMLSN